MSQWVYLPNGYIFPMGGGGVGIGNLSKARFLVVADNRPYAGQRLVEWLRGCVVEWLRGRVVVWSEKKTAQWAAAFRMGGALLVC